MGSIEVERPPTLDSVHFACFPIGFHFWHTFFFFSPNSISNMFLGRWSPLHRGGNPEQERWWMVLTLLLMPLTCICAFWSVHLREWPFAAAWDHWSQLVIGQHQCRRPSKAAARLFEKRNIHWNFTLDHVHIFFASSLLLILGKGSLLFTLILSEILPQWCRCGRAEKSC